VLEIESADHEDLDMRAGCVLLKLFFDIGEGVSVLKDQFALLLGTLQLAASQRGMHHADAPVRTAAGSPPLLVTNERRR